MVFKIEVHMPYIFGLLHDNVTSLIMYYTLPLLLSYFIVYFSCVGFKFLVLEFSLVLKQIKIK